MTETIPTKRTVPTMYAIQRKRDGLWSRGGGYVKWGKFPKTWGAGPFKNHLNMFKIHAYKFNVDKLKEIVEKKAYYNPYAVPEEFQYKLIHKSFPYWDCEVVTFDSDTLAVTRRMPAEQFAWYDCYWPSYMKNDERYIENMIKFCNEFGLEFD